MIATNAADAVHSHVSKDVTHAAFPPLVVVDCPEKRLAAESAAAAAAAGETTSPAADSTCSSPPSLIAFRYAGDAYCEEEEGVSIHTSSGGETTDGEDSRYLMDAQPSSLEDDVHIVSSSSSSGDSAWEDGRSSNSSSPDEISAEGATTTTATASSATRFSHYMEEIRLALRANDPEYGQPFINMEQQRDELERERYHRHIEYLCQMNQQSMLSGRDTEIASCILLHEAHRLQFLRRQQYRRLDSSPAITQSEVHLQWSNIKEEVELHLHQHAFIQRRLSCMCLFNPQVAYRPYCDNDEYREERMRRQKAIIAQLQQQAQVGKNPYFLEPDTVVEKGMWNEKNIEEMWRDVGAENDDYYNGGL